MDTPVIENETEVSEIVQYLTELGDMINVAYSSLFTPIFSEDWKNAEEAEQLVLREVLNVLCTAGNVLREKFDGDVLKGHADGTVPNVVESIRKQREGDTPGKKAKVLTPAEILAKRMKK